MKTVEKEGEKLMSILLSPQNNILGSRLLVKSTVNQLQHIVCEQRPIFRPAFWKLPRQTRANRVRTLAHFGERTMHREMQAVGEYSWFEGERGDDRREEKREGPGGPART